MNVFKSIMRGLKGIDVLYTLLVFYPEFPYVHGVYSDFKVALAEGDRLGYRYHIEIHDFVDCMCQSKLMYQGGPSESTDT